MFFLESNELGRRRQRFHCRATRGRTMGREVGTDAAITYLFWAKERVLMPASDIVTHHGTRE